MDRHQFLAGIHAAYQPRSYLEIGINIGLGLALSRTRTIGVDPAFKINTEFECDAKLVKATSDDFFARPDAIARFPEGVVDFGFIDGLHIFEFALRDFMNTERLSAPASVIVLDDMLPRKVSEAARNRYTWDWAGDVFKVADVLRKYRPDLVVVPVDTTPTGVLLVLGADPTSTVLADHYDEIVAEFVQDDPQVITDTMLHRRDAADPNKLLALSMWTELAAARDSGADTSTIIQAAADLRGTATYVSNPPEDRPFPPVKAAPKPPPSAPKAPTAPPTLVRRIRLAIKRRL